MGLIMLAFKISEQITVTQGVNQVKNQKNYAVQEAKLTLDQELELVFSEENLGANPLGATESVLRKLMRQFSNDHQVINEGYIGRGKKVSYRNELGEAAIKPIPLKSPGDDEEQGWVDQDGHGDGIEVKAFEVRFPVESIIQEGETSRSTSSEYVYEIQWESRDDGDVLTETDIWGNIYYQINRPGGLLPLSADSVSRKMSKIYHFQDQTPEYLENFPTGDLSKRTLNGTYGFKNPYVADVTDGRNHFDNDVSQLNFEGSLLATNGFNLRGSDSNAQLVTKNLLALTNLGNQVGNIQESHIENLGIDARTGLYFGLEPNQDEQQQIIVTNTARSVIETTNLVINNTISRDNPKVATYIESGEIQVNGVQQETTDFRQYKGNSNSLNLQKNNWQQYQQGNMIISHSKVHLSSNQVSGASTHIQVANNFMLTNAGMNGSLDEDSFSYFEDESNEIIRQPSEMILSGGNTLFEVNRYSFIDAPKRFQRQLKGDNNPQKQIYVNNQGFNKIKLEDKSQMKLGFTGVESFRFESEKETIFSMKVLPGVNLFNPYFLEKGFNNDEIEGKVILEMFDEKDKIKLTNLFDEKGIPYETTNHIDGHFSTCQNGVVTIYTPNKVRENQTYEVVTRYFSYLTEIDYKKGRNQWKK